MNKVVLWSDAHNWPSLPLMKISAHHKSLGDTVTLYDGADGCDILYCSKVFSDRYSADIPAIPKADQIIFGGSGYAITDDGATESYDSATDTPLSAQIENIYPDYDLYPQHRNTAYGFLTRGCPNNCGFCIVSKKEGRCARHVAELSDFWRGQKSIKLLDANLLACRDREKLLRQLADCGAKVDYTQGLDARFVDNDIARLIAATNVDMVHFAFDSMAHEAAIVRGLTAYQPYIKSDRDCKVYILTNNGTTHTEDWYRVRRCIELGYQPYVMTYRKGDHPRFLTDLARWCNNSLLYRTCDFADYVPRVDGKRCGELYHDILEGE